MKRYLTLVMLFILSVLLISEWIYPFAELTELSTANWIILFITLSLGSFFPPFEILLDNPASYRDDYLRFRNLLR